MKRISLFKKISIFRAYKKSLKSIKTELEQTFGARIDNAWRIYNVINIPNEVIGEPYNLRKADIDKIAESSVKEYTTELSKFLNTKGLQELYDFYEVKKVDKYSYLVVIGFSLFKSNEYYDIIRYRILPTISVISLILLLILFL
jgi:hypothetical protein